MKLKTNFSFSFGRIIPSLVWIGWTLALGALLSGLWLSGAAVRDRIENPALKKNVDETRKDLPEKIKTGSAPSRVELEDLSRRLASLNALGAGGGESVSSVLSRLEKELPSGARLLSFQADQTSGEIQLSVEARGLEELSQLLAALEADAAFTRVNLTKQARSTDGDGGWVEFSVDLTEARP